jgi:hypothetical protein
MENSFLVRMQQGFTVVRDKDYIIQWHTDRKAFERG